MRFEILFFVLMMAITVGYAQADPTPHTSLSEHSDVLVWLVVTLLGVLAFFIVRTLNAIDSNQTKLSESLDNFRDDIYQRVDALAEAFSKLKGEHEVYTGHVHLHQRSEDKRKDKE